MTTFFETVATLDLLHRIGWGLIHSTWQIAILAGVYFLARLLIPSKRLAIRYRFGFCILLLMPVVPVVTMLLMEPLPEKTASVAEPLSASLDSATTEPTQNRGLQIVPYEEFMRDHVGPNDVFVMGGNAPESQGEETQIPAAGAVSNTDPVDWLALLERHVWLFSIAWLSGVIFLSFRLSSELFAIRKLRRSGIADIPECWTERLIHLCEKLRIKQKVQLLSSWVIDSPVLIGIVRPVILLPASLLSGLTPEEVEAILAHELAHIRRHDYLANLVQMIIETLLFYHPCLWWVSNALREDREYICDDFAVHRAGTNSLVYVKTLTHLEQFR